MRGVLQWFCMGIGHPGKMLAEVATVTKGQLSVLLLPNYCITYCISLTSYQVGVLNVKFCLLSIPGDRPRKLYAERALNLPLGAELITGNMWYIFLFDM